MTWNAWEFASDTWTGTGESLVGFAVLASDGLLGRVHSATADVGTSHIVVDTEDIGSGELVILPAGVVDRIDKPARQIHVGRTLHEIGEAPTLTRLTDDPTFHQQLEDYYGGYYWTAPGDAISSEIRDSVAKPPGS
jgi:hypothetical protein